jgi:hypothetical protein
VETNAVPFALSGTADLKDEEGWNNRRSFGSVCRKKRAKLRSG